MAADVAQLSEEVKRIMREGEEFIGKWEFIEKSRFRGWNDVDFSDFALAGPIRIRNDITSIEPVVKSRNLRDLTIKHEESDEDDSGGRWVMTGWSFDSYGSSYLRVDLKLVFDTITLKGEQVNAFVGTRTIIRSRPYRGAFSFDGKRETIKTKGIALIKVE